MMESNGFRFVAAVNIVLLLVILFLLRRIVSRTNRLHKDI